MLETARTYLQQGKHQAAIDEAMKIIKSTKDQSTLIDAHKIQAMAYTKTKDYQNAILVYNSLSTQLNYQQGTDSEFERTIACAYLLRASKLPPENLKLIVDDLTACISLGLREPNIYAARAKAQMQLEIYDAQVLADIEIAINLKIYSSLKDKYLRGCNKITPSLQVR